MKRLSFILRWLARLLSLVMVFMVVVFVRREGIYNPLDFIPEERGAYVALLVMMIAGLLAWKWEVLGGLLVLAGFGSFWYFEGSFSERPFAVFPVAGCLFLIAWLLEHKPGLAPAPTPSEPKTTKATGKAKGKDKRKRKASKKT